MQEGCLEGICSSNCCLLIQDLKPFSICNCAKKETVDIDILVTFRNGDRKLCNLSE